MSVDPSKRYDRQIRIWGVSGQSRLERTKVLLLNCSPTGSGAMHGHASAAAAAAAFTAPSCENPDLRCFDPMMVVGTLKRDASPISRPVLAETLKNLVLGGIASFCIVDGAKVTPRDLGNNFLVESASLGEPRAKVVTELLQELNEGVAGSYVEEDPATLLATNPSFFAAFTLVIATQVCGLHAAVCPLVGSRERIAGRLAIGQAAASCAKDGSKSEAELWGGGMPLANHACRDP